MARLIDVVKRGKRLPEPFQREKLHASIVATCLSVRTPDGQAHDVAHDVCEYVVIWGHDKSEVTSVDIRRQATKGLEKYHPEAAYFYRQYNHII